MTNNNGQNPQIQATQAQELIQLSQSDRRAACARFDSLKQEEQYNLVVNAVQSKDKKELLFLGRDTKELIQSLPSIELIKALSACNETETDTLLEHATGAQINGLFDIHGWNEDGIDLDGFCDLCKRLASLEPDRFSRLCEDLDTDYLAAALGAFCEGLSFKPEQYAINRDLGHSTHFTPDDFDCNHPVLQDFLIRIYEWDDKLLSMIGGRIASITSSDLEKQAFANHKKRMDKAGIPLKKKSSKIYARPESEVRASIPGTQLWEPKPSASATGTAVVASAEDSPFLTKAIHLAVDLEMENSRQSSARFMPLFRSRLQDLLDKVAMADGIVFDDTSRLKTMRKTEIFIGLGLEQLSDSSVDKAARVLLDSCDPEHYFRLGNKCLIPLREVAGKLKSKWDKSSKKRLPSPKILKNMERLQLAAREIPCGLTKEGKTRPIRDLRDVLQLTQMIQMMANV